MRCEALIYNFQQMSVFQSCSNSFFISQLLVYWRRNKGTREMHGNNTNIKIENHDSHLLEGNVAKMSL